MIALKKFVGDAVNNAAKLVKIVYAAIVVNVVIVNAICVNLFFAILCLKVYLFCFVWE